MRSKSSTYFEVKIRYDKVMEDGASKTVTEQYVVEATSGTFTEAEANIIKDLQPYFSKATDYEILAITKATYKEIFFSDLDSDDMWFKVKLNFVTLDEKSLKEKKTKVTYLVQAHNNDLAVKHVKEVVDGSTIDYEIPDINETKIMDVYEHNA